MEQLPRLQARIASLRELHALIGALRVLAASHVKEAQGALPGIRGYVKVVEDAIAEGAALLPAIDLREVAGRPRAAGVLIVACSEHGFVGAFNERLLDRAAAEREPGQDLVVVGRRGAILAAERGLEVARSFPMATHVNGVPEVARRVAEHLATASAADIVYGSYRINERFEAEKRSILPLDPALLVGSTTRRSPVHHLAPEALLQRLAGEYLFAEVTRAVMESLASENGARLRVLENANHNIGDKLDDLRRREQTLRQEAITEELLDVVTGSEAVLSELAAEQGD